MCSEIFIGIHPDRAPSFQDLFFFPQAAVFLQSVSLCELTLYCLRAFVSHKSVFISYCVRTAAVDERAFQHHSESDSSSALRLLLFSFSRFSTLHSEQLRVTLRWTHVNLLPFVAQCLLVKWPLISSSIHVNAWGFLIRCYFDIWG